MIDVIPSINCPDGDFECVKDKVSRAAEFAEWVHVDVADGCFTLNKSWSQAERWAQLGSPSKLEVHLMVQDPEAAIPKWLDAGAKRVIFHLEAIEHLPGDHAAQRAQKLATLCQERGAQAGLAINPATPVERLMPYLNIFSFFQVLAVNPGPAGQQFLPVALTKIEFLREQLPDATIEVDGGIVPETAAAARERGATILVAGSYTLGSQDPKAAYEQLRVL